MAKSYFLSYSSGYDQLKELFKRLMQALGFDSVYIFDHPDQERVTTVIKEQLQSHDGVVVLYGPHERPPKNAKNIRAAEYPDREAHIALGMDKPLALIVHQGTYLPDFLRDYHTPPRFDFWTPASFQENVHHVVKHLLDLKRRVEVPPGATEDGFGHRIEPPVLKRRTSIIPDKSAITGFKLQLKQGSDRLNALKIAAFGPHVDDIELGCGATLARLRDQFDASIYYYVFSSAVLAWDGERTIPEGARLGDARKAFQLLINGRRDETMESPSSPTLSIKNTKGREIGRFTYFTLTDSRMEPEEIRTILRRLQTQELADVDVVFVPSFKDVHQDHQAMGNAALQVFRKQETVLFYKSPDSGKHPLQRFNPTLYVDVSDEVRPDGVYTEMRKTVDSARQGGRVTYADIKLALLRCFETERDKPWYREEAFRAGMIENAHDAYLPIASDKDKYAEGFEGVLRI